MKNNIRYKGNTNNTSVIIFLKLKSSSDVILFWRTSTEVFVMLVVIFDLHFVVVSSFVNVLHSHFLFDVIPHPSTHFILSAQCITV